MLKRVLLSVSLFLISPPLFAQQDLLPAVGKADLLPFYSLHVAAFDEFAEGKTQPKMNIEDQEIIDKFAIWYVDRVTWPSVHGDSEATAKILKEFDDKVAKKIATTTALKNNHDFVDRFGKQLAIRFKEAFDLDFMGNNRALIIAGELLVSAAKLKQPDLGDYLVELVKDGKKHDVIKLYALRAMREYFPARMVSALEMPLQPVNRLVKDRDVARVNALNEFITREVPKTMEIGAYRYLRQEAIETLASAKVAAVMALPKQSLEGPVAPLLLHVLQKGKLTPEPTLAEKVEAAIGICNMQVKDQDQALYNADPGINLVGEFMVEFVDSYRTDWVNFANRDNKGKSPPYLPWKIDAKRFEAALTTLEKNTGSAQAKELKNIVTLNILTPMSNTSQYVRIESNFATEIHNVISKLAPQGPVPLFTFSKMPEFQP